jgi:hypothetical protein
VDVRKVRRDTVSTKQLPEGFTNSLKCRKKSTPKIGNCTAASRKGQVKHLPLKERVKLFSPQQAMGRPDALERAGPDGGDGDEWGKTE